MTSVGTPLEISTIPVADVRRLRVSRWSATSLDRLAEIVAAYPARSVRRAATGEYAIVNGWRHRREIAHLFELSAPTDPVGIVAAAMAASLADGARLLVAIETESVRQPAFYERVGMSLMEEVVSLEHHSPRTILAGAGLATRPLRDLDDDTVNELVRLDHAAFPWLWHNSATEFRAYVDEPGVELYGVDIDGAVRAYLGVTAFLGWGHIDRIAVEPGLQGQGIGERLARFGIGRLVQLGSRTVGLSTQRANAPAHRMYAKLGFTRALAADYRLYGRWLGDEQRPVETIT